MKTRDAIRKLLAKGYEVSSFGTLSIKPGEDATISVGNSARVQESSEDPSEKFTSRRKAIRSFLRRRKKLLPHLTAAAEPEAVAAKVSVTGKKSKKNK